MRISSHVVSRAAASLPSGSGLLVGGGNVLGNDGLIDISSQNGLDIPLVHTPGRRTSLSGGKPAMSSSSLLGLVGSAPKAFAMTKKYSGTLLNTVARAGSG